MAAPRPIAAAMSGGRALETVGVQGVVLVFGARLPPV